jgi:hypothetical protein
VPSSSTTSTAPGARAGPAALPAGNGDLSSCGEAIAVKACAGAAGVTVTDAAVDAALDALDARLADPAGFASDATALVGQERAATFIAAVRKATEDKLQAMLGQLYGNAAAASAALQAAADAQIDDAYATPLHYVDRLPPVVGDAARARQEAADGLLDYMASFDFANSEFAAR